MGSRLAVAPALMLLAGCGLDGGGEDFTVEVKRPVAAVMSPYLTANINEAKVLFPGISFVRQRPNERELLFTIPGSGDTESTIRLRFEPLRNGTATMVHATVDTPPMKARIEGIDKYLSEPKVERMLKDQIESSGRAQEAHTAVDSQSFSGTLAGLAIATNTLFLQRALELKDSPERLGALLAFGDPDGLGDTAAGDAAGSPMDDPENMARSDEAAHDDSQWQEERQAEDAAAPMDDAYPE